MNVVYCINYPTLPTLLLLQPAISENDAASIVVFCFNQIVDERNLHAPFPLSSEHTLMSHNNHSDAWQWNMIRRALCSTKGTNSHFNSFVMSANRSRANNSHSMPTLVCEIQMNRRNAMLCISIVYYQNHYSLHLFHSFHAPLSIRQISFLITTWTFQHRESCRIIAISVTSCFQQSRGILGILLTSSSRFMHDVNSADNGARISTS